MATLQLGQIGSSKHVRGVRHTILQSNVGNSTIYSNYYSEKGQQSFTEIKLTETVKSTHFLIGNTARDRPVLHNSPISFHAEIYRHCFTKIQISKCFPGISAEKNFTDPGCNPRMANRLEWLSLSGLAGNKRKKPNVPPPSEYYFGDDGITHSLPTKKYGPYKCPRCFVEFNTSQTFAAHMVSANYKYESKEEKERRQAAKYKKTSRNLPLSPYKVTTFPADFRKNGEASGRARNEFGDDRVAYRAERGKHEEAVVPISGLSKYPELDCKKIKMKLA